MPAVPVIARPALVRTESSEETVASPGLVTTETTGAETEKPEEQEARVKPSSGRETSVSVPKDVSPLSEVVTKMQETASRTDTCSFLKTNQSFRKKGGSDRSCGN